MVGVQVRDARPEDWPGVAVLLAELGRPDVLGREDEAEHRQAFAAYVERADTLALVRTKAASYSASSTSSSANDSTP